MTTETKPAPQPKPQEPKLTREQETAAFQKDLEALSPNQRLRVVRNANMILAEAHAAKMRRRELIKAGVGTAAGIAVPAGAVTLGVAEIRNPGFTNRAVHAAINHLHPPEAPAAPETTPTPEIPDTPFNNLMRPTIEAAFQERARRSKTESSFKENVDPELNDSRVNFLLLLPETQLTVKQTSVPILFSYNFKDGTISVVEINKNIRSTDYEHFLVERNKQKGSHNLVVAQAMGDLKGSLSIDKSIAKTSTESLTGLAVDKIITVPDQRFFTKLTDLLGRFEITNPKQEPLRMASPFSRNDPETPRLTFYADNPGVQRNSDGLTAAVYLFSDVRDGETNPQLLNERALRTYLVFEGLFNAFKKSATEKPDFWNAGLPFLSQLSFFGFPLDGLSGLSSAEVLEKLDSASGPDGQLSQTNFPTLTKAVYLGGNNGNFKNELSVESPKNGNETSTHLAKDHWQDARTFIANELGNK